MAQFGPSVLYLREVVHSEGRRQLVGVSEGDLIGRPLQGDLCPQEVTAPHSVPSEKLHCHNCLES